MGSGAGRLNSGVEQQEDERIRAFSTHYFRGRRRRDRLAPCWRPWHFVWCSCWFPSPYRNRSPGSSRAVDTSRLRVWSAWVFACCRAESNSCVCASLQSLFSCLRDAQRCFVVSHIPYWRSDPIKASYLLGSLAGCIAIHSTRPPGRASLLKPIRVSERWAGVLPPSDRSSSGVTRDMHGA